MQLILCLFIVITGPTDSNVNDFWRMVLELDIKKIVMLTNCVEDGRVNKFPCQHIKHRDGSYVPCYTALWSILVLLTF